MHNYVFCPEFKEETIVLFNPGADEDTLVWISNFTWQGNHNIYLFHHETKTYTVDYAFIYELFQFQTYCGLF